MTECHSRALVALLLFMGIGLACDTTKAAEVLRFDFDEGSGTNAADSALSDGTPTPDDSVTLRNGAAFAPGKFGTAMELSGTNAPWDYAVFTNSSLGDMMTNAPGATFSCWLMVTNTLWKASTNNDRGDLIYIALPNDPSHVRFEIQIGESALIRIIARCNDTDAQTFIATGPNQFRSNQWVHIAGVANFAGKYLAIYTNGQIALKTTGISNWGTSPTVCSGVKGTNASIGANWPNLDEAFIGRMDEVRFWNEPLSDAEIAAVYVHNPTTTNTLTSSTNSVTYGQTLTLTARLTVAGTNVPTGTVTFRNGTNILGTRTLSGSTNVTAIFTTNSLPVGTYTNITAVYDGDDDFSGSTSTSLMQTVNVATVTVSSGLTANNKVYDGTNTATISSNNVVLSGVIAADTNNVKLSTNGYTATFASATVGSGKAVTVSGLTLTGSAATNYTLTQPSLTANITVATVTVSSGLTANNKVYDGTNTATISSNNVVLSGVIAADTNNVKLSTNGYTATFASATVGSGKAVTVSGLTLTGSAATNYTLTQPSLTANITVATVTVSSGLTANNKVYDGTNTATISSNNVVLSGVIAADTNNVKLSTNGYTATFASATVGSGKAVTVSGLTLTGSAATNYTLTQPSLTANITVATVTVSSGLTANNKVYDGTNTATISSNNVVLSGVIAADTNNVKLSTNGYTATFASATVGSGKAVTVSGLTLTGSAATNYTLTQPSLTANITVATVTVTANNTNRIYGAADPSFTASYSGFIGSENVSVLSGSPSFSTPATTASSVAGSPYSIIATNGTLSATNYTFAFVNGQLTITRASSANAVSTSANPSPTSSNLTFTATLTAVLPGSGTPTGTAQFRADGAPLGSPATLASGVASLTNNSLSHGTHTITAEYAGDGNFFGSTNSLGQSQVINTRPVIGSDSLQRHKNYGVKVRSSILLTNDTDADGDSLTLSSVNSTSTAGGTVVTSNIWIHYTPPTGFTNADSFSYVITDSGLQATGSVSINIRVDLGQSQNVIAVDDLGNGSSRVTFAGIPGRAYTIQYTTNLVTPGWQTLGTNTAAGTGQFEFTDAPGVGAPARFYRTTYP